MISHEDDLRHQRMTWMLSLQAFLFAGVYFGWDRHWSITLLFFSLGTLSCLSTAVVLWTSVKSVYLLVDWWDEKVYQETKTSKFQYAGPPVIGLGYKNLPAVVHVLCPWYSLPVILFMGWAFILLARLLEL